MTILVTGATGNIGRMLVDHLLAAGRTDVRALTNHPERAQLPSGVEIAEGFLGRVDSLPDALIGVDQIYLAPYPSTIEPVLELARAAGVRHVVDLAGPPENWWYPISVAVEKSGMHWTHLWPGEFMENSTMWAERIIESGCVREPFPDAANAPIAMDDIASAAAAVLIDEHTHHGRSHVLTGPETLTRVGLLDRISDAIGRPLTFETVSRQETIDDLTHSMGDFAITYVDGLESSVHNPQQVDRTLTDITGSATTFAHWAQRNVDSFR
ncbi:SDR family oxidoreductase [Rhodococcus sp. IEGM1428]|uniref:SDR family oxidoreductase n=1 Tax=Rhodococcus sp. IEGM1428 TaxID=3392191 RepID=UPI003D11E8E1